MTSGVALMRPKQTFQHYVGNLRGSAGLLGLMFQTSAIPAPHLHFTPAYASFRYSPSPSIRVRLRVSKFTRQILDIPLASLYTCGQGGNL